MAALNDKHSGGLAVTAVQDYWIRRAPGWVVSEFMFANITPVNTDCIVMFKNPSHGLRVADWWVTSEQLDAGSGVVLKIGILNSTSTPTGLTKEWASSGVLGRAAVSSMDRNSDGLCSLGYALPGNDIGIHISAIPAVNVVNTKKIVMGVLFAPW